MKTIFLDRYGTVRPGWKILIFVLLAVAFVFGFTAPFRLLDPQGDEAGLDWIIRVVVPVMAVPGVLLASYLSTRWLNRKPFAAVGLWLHHRAAAEILWGCLLGFLMMAFIFFALYAGGFVQIGFRSIGATGIAGVVVSAALLFAAGAMVEEVVFRGYPFQTLIQGITLLPAVILMAVLFSAAHLTNPNTSLFGIVNIGLAAIWLSFAYLKTKGLWLPFGLHFGWNFSQTTIFAFPTSGVEFAEYKLFSTVVTGPEWLTGGAFGPEGGALATVTLIACTFYVLKAKRFEAVAGIVTLDTIEDLVPEPERLP
jgi:membrane protease YdiL (CAAX protease family)